MAVPPIAAKNCSIEVPDIGQRSVYCVGLGHGFKVISSESETRRFRTYYPYKRTSGTWWVDIVFASHGEYQAFMVWFVMVCNMMSDPHKTTVAPMTVSVPSRQFLKRGYPVTAATFGDRFGQVVYTARLGFSSANDPLSPVKASEFTGAYYDAAAQFFYPGGVQSSSAPPPSPWLGVIASEQDVYGGGGLIRRS